MIGSAKGGVFLSYARKDGEEFANQVRLRLQREAPDIGVKQDRLILEGGIGWLNTVLEAIDSSEFLVLIMTPQAMKSEPVRKEWLHARQQGVCVYPVKAASDEQLSFASAPGWMSRAHFYDLEKEWPTFVGHLRAGCRTPRVPFMAPDLPADFVERRDEFRAAKQQLLKGKTTALTGGGGFGKTTLASALCHDPEIVENFDDGILWVTLGQKPAVLPAAITLYAALTGQRPPFASEDDAAIAIAEVLGERVCLMVIDDVWQTQHLKPFLRGGTKCVRLVTTRRAGVFSEIEAAGVSIDQMSPEQSAQLLQSGLREFDSTEIAGLGTLLGNWPIRLELARALLRRRLTAGDSPSNALRYLKTALDRKGSAALPVDAVIEASFDALTPSNQQRLVEFSIFPEDTQIPVATAGALWGLEEFEAEDAALEIADTSLLKLDLQRGTLAVHDDLQAWLKPRAASPGALHSRLVDAWPEWHRLPNEYAWRRLTWHLAQAGRMEDLRHTLLDPLWIAAKLEATDINALIADYDQGVRGAETGRIQRALRLSAHVLAADKSQLRGQFAGRLGDDPLVQGIPIAGTSLTPRTQTLTPPGTPLIRTLTGHDLDVISVAVTRDGSRAVSIGGDWNLKVWNVHDGAELRSVHSGRGEFRAIGLTGDGQRAVTGSWNGSLAVFDVASGTRSLELTGHEATVNALAVATLANRVVSADNDGVLKVWNLDDGSELRSFVAHPENLAAVAVTPEGSRAITSGVDNTLKVWDLDAVRELCTLTGHRSFAVGLAISPDGTRAISAGLDTELKLWDLERAVEIRTLTGHAGSVRCVAVSEDWKRAVSGSEDRTIKLWDLETGQVLRSLSGHTGDINAVVLTAGGKRVISAARDGTIKVWDLEFDGELPVAAGSAVQGLALVNGGSRVISADWTSLTIWDVPAAAALRTLVRPGEGLSSFGVSEDGATAVFASSDQLTVWDLKSGAHWNTSQVKYWWRSLVAIRGDGLRAVASWGQTMGVWDLKTGKELKRLASNSPEILDLVLTPDGRTAISATDDRTLRVWDVDNGAEKFVLAAHSQAPEAVAITGDGRTAVSASWDRTLRVWDLTDGSERMGLKGLRDTVHDIAVSPDGRLAVTAGGAQVCLWNLDESRLEAAFSCDGQMTSCVFVSERLLIAGDDAGKVHFLAVERQEH